MPLAPAWDFVATKKKFVKATIKIKVYKQEDQLTTDKRRTLTWFRFVTRYQMLSKTILKGTYREVENKDNGRRNRWTTSGIRPGERMRSSLEIQRTAILGGRCLEDDLQFLYNRQGHGVLNVWVSN